MASAPGQGGGKDKDKKDGADQSMIGTYKIVGFIAGGKNSQVWEVQAGEGQKRIALKQLTAEAMKDPEQLAAIKNEFMVGKSLEHPNIVKYFDGHWGSMFKKEAYFTMELFMAPNLKAQLFNNLNSVQVRLRRIVESAAMAYQHLHDKGFINRDIKPDNVLVNKSGELKVIDMSLAAKPAGALAKALNSKSKTAKGTRSYMAPEQIMRKPLTFQVDLYSFGVMLFEMLTGGPPFAGSTPNDLLMRHIQEPPPPPSMINSNVTEEMDRVVLRLLSKKPDQRHKSFNEFLAEFRRVNPWKEEVVEKRELTEKEKAEQEIGENLGERLDSRTDAMRTMLGIAAPKKKSAEAPPAETKPKPAAASSPAAPVQPAVRPAAPVAPAAMAPFPPGMYPGGFLPGQFAPGQFPPGQYPGGQFPPGMMPPPGYYPQPGYPMPPQVPGQMLPTGMPAPWVGMPGAVPGQVPPGGVTAGGPVPPGVAAPAVPGAARPPQAGGAPAPPRAAVPRPAVPPAAAPPAAAAKPAKPPVAPPTTKPAAPPAGDAMKINDLLGFDDLPSA